MSKKEYQSDWYSHEITDSRKMRVKCHRLSLFDEYKFWRNKTKPVTEYAKYKYYTDLVKDSKTIWKCINILQLLLTVHIQLDLKSTRKLALQIPKWLQGNLIISLHHVFKI